MRRWEGFSIYIALAKRAGEFLFTANHIDFSFSEQGREEDFETERILIHNIMGLMEIKAEQRG
jgi:hypothetical protein